MPDTGSAYGTAAARWAGVGPYYAMFPVDFANSVIRRHTKPGDVVLDPFAGRGTSIFSAAVQGRVGLGIELSPVGWVYARTKLRPASCERVAERIEKIGTMAWRYRARAEDLPEFFKVCFAAATRRFLLAARAQLDWMRCRVDRTVMALILVHLHGKRADSLSNQMRQTKSMSPEYAIQWWRKREMRPPRRDPVRFLLKKLKWRYAKGVPEASGSRVYLGDSSVRLRDIASQTTSGKIDRVSLLFTSPPYYRLTNYHYDQWLRGWMLGGPPSAARVGGRFRGKFEDRREYRALLRSVFSSAARVLKRDAIVYVRTDRRPFTYRNTREILREVFPRKKLHRLLRPVTGPTQTLLFKNRRSRKGEVDLILRP